jgi:hypothetical protein
MPGRSSKASKSQRYNAPVPLTHEQLCEELPDMEALFTRDETHTAKDEVLAQIIEAILDSVGVPKH